jgi:hypothetical protein
MVLKAFLGKLWGGIRPEEHIEGNHEKQTYFWPMPKI